ATAGHCVNPLSLPSVRFVFGFRMIDADTAVTRFDPSQVYYGVEVVTGALDDLAEDYAVIRVDRPITAPGAIPLPLRQTGAVPVGTPVGIIGHPTGLPTKVTFGDATVVRNDASEPFFTTNIDTFRGNSGSPVINADTGIVEGILVRGAG